MKNYKFSIPIAFFSIVKKKFKSNVLRLKIEYDLKTSDGIK